MTSSNPPVVLIAEDEVLVSMFLVDIIEEAGMAVCGTARTCEEGRAAAAARPPDLALVDVNLKGGSGLDLAAGLMADHGTAIILVTGESGVADWPEVEALRPAAVLEKPFLPDRLIAALQGAAEARAAAATPADAAR